VLIEPVDGNGFRITGAGGLSVGLTAEGATVAEAMDRLAARVRQRVDAGAKLDDLDVSEIPDPRQHDAGYLRDDPLFDAWREAIEANRRQLEEDTEAL